MSKMVNVERIGLVKVGDIVHFKKFSSDSGIGNIINIHNEEDNVMVDIYTTDHTGGHTITLPVGNIVNFVKTSEEEILKPRRYNKRGKLECWDVIIDQEMNFLEGSVLKYIWRYKEKNGVRDLEKAKVFIDKLISEFEKNENN
jgi:hypothetical protein